MRQRGFSLIEVLFAMLILAVVITTALAVFTERTRRLQQAGQTILAWQALANEAEARRRIDYGALDTADPEFVTSTAILQPLKPFETSAVVESAQPHVKRVTLTVRWSDGKRVASLTLLRGDTGGTNLW